MEPTPYEEIDIASYIRLLNKRKRTIIGITLATLLLSTALILVHRAKTPALFIVESKILSAKTSLIPFLNQPTTPCLLPIETATVERSAIKQIIAASIKKAGYAKPKDAPVTITITRAEDIITLETQAPKRSVAPVAGEEAHTEVLARSNAILEREQKRIAGEIKKTENMITFLKEDFNMTIKRTIRDLSRIPSANADQLSIYLSYIQYKITLDEKIEALEEKKNQLKSMTFIAAETIKKPTVLTQTGWRRSPLLIFLPLAFILGLFLAIIIVSITEWWSKNRSQFAIPR